MDLAAGQSEQTAGAPDSRALKDFLHERKPPTRCLADLSLSVIKLMGPGEYVLERPGDPTGPLRPGGPGLHPFHSAQSPLRRPGTQRLIKALLAKQPTPYTDPQLMPSPRTARTKKMRRKSGTGNDQTHGSRGDEHEYRRNLRCHRRQRVSQKGVFVRMLKTACGRTTGPGGKA